MIEEGRERGRKENTEEEEKVESWLVWLVLSIQSLMLRKSDLGDNKVPDNHGYGENCSA